MRLARLTWTRVLHALRPAALLAILAGALGLLGGLHQPALGADLAQVPGHGVLHGRDDNPSGLDFNLDIRTGFGYSLAMIQIPLYGRNGSIVAHAMIDDEDEHKASLFRWWLLKVKPKSTTWAYAHSKREDGSKVLLHRLVMDTKKGLVTDHRDHDGLNCQKSNLRICTHAENMRNRMMRRDNTHGERCMEKTKRGWRVVIYANKVRHKKCFSPNRLEEARSWRDAKLLELHGEFANLNHGRQA